MLSYSQKIMRKSFKLQHTLITINAWSQKYTDIRRHVYNSGLVLLWFSVGSTGVTIYPKKYAHGFCFAVLCCGHTLTGFPISIRLTSLALWQSNDCPSASKATLMNMDKYFTWIHYERLHNHNKAKHNKTVCIFLGIYCTFKSCMRISVCAVRWTLYPGAPNLANRNVMKYVRVNNFNFKTLNND